MDEYIFIAVCVFAVLIPMVIRQHIYKKKIRAKSDEELIKKYEELTDRIAREAYAGSQCRSIIATTAVNATNNRIDKLKSQAEPIENELSRRGYFVDRSKMNGKAIKNKSGDASVVGRAVVGGIIAGPTGAIVGAASAIDKNQKNKSDK